MKFMNMWKFGAANGLMDKEAGGEGGGGGGGDESSGGDEKINITQAQLDDLVQKAVKTAMSSNKSDDEEESLTEKRKREKEESENLKARDLKNQRYATASYQFDNFIKDNIESLPESMKKIREDAEKAAKNKDDLSEVVPLMWGTAAKEYFGDEENLKNLTKSDQDWVKENVLSKRYENQIDGVEAAKYIERAIEASKRKSDDEKRRGGGGKSTNYSGHANLQKRTDGFFPDHVTDVTGM